MAEIIDLEGMLDTLRGFGPLRRVILGTSGTLQATLTAYFGSKVGVEVRFQSDDQDKNHFVREADLVCYESGTVVCRARTDVVVEDDEVRRLLRERNMGLGQIVQLLRIPTSFDLKEVGEEDGVFWRVYQLRGAGFSCCVRESFPASLYQEDTPGGECP